MARMSAALLVPDNGRLVVHRMGPRFLVLEAEPDTEGIRYQLREGRLSCIGSEPRDEEVAEVLRELLEQLLQAKVTLTVELRS